MKKKLCILFVCVVGNARAAEHKLSLLDALQKDDQNVVERLLTAEPIPVLRKQAASCEPPLLIAALQKRWLAVFKLVSKNYICPYARDKDGTQAIHHAAQLADSTYLEILLNDKHDNVDEPTENPRLTRQSNRYRTPLFFAVCAGRPKAVELLLEKKPTLVTTDQGLSLVQLVRAKKEAAIESAKDRYEECERLLLEYGNHKREEQGCSIL